MSFRINILFAFFCTIQGQKKIRKNYIHVICDCVDVSVYLVLILDVLFSVFILFLELGCLGVVLFLIFF